MNVHSNSNVVGPTVAIAFTLTIEAVVQIM